MWTLLLVEVTSLARQRLSHSTWRRILLIPYVSGILATVHAFTAGTDAVSPAMIGSASATVGLGVSLDGFPRHLRLKQSRKTYVCRCKITLPPIRGCLSKTGRSATMAFGTRTRASLYRKLSSLLGEEDADMLISQFPASELGELVTKEFLRAEIAALRAELRVELHSELANLRNELQETREQLRSEYLALRVEIAERFEKQSERLRQQTIFFVGSVFAAIGATVALTRLLG